MRPSEISILRYIGLKLDESSLTLSKLITQRADFEILKQKNETPIGIPQQVLAVYGEGTVIRTVHSVLQATLRK